MEGRQDPFYYIPSIVELEKKIRKISSLRLRDFILAISSGATPSVKEEEKFYSDEVNGVPFIRVQNLSPTNELMLHDLRYINQETHRKYLNRSQVKGGDLLVKITGVGRMAVSSVVPAGFEGNTNQHLVVIKTKDFETSEVLATFLNTDIGEKLASRRATGGTRPALDYSALKSIPIVFKPEIIETIKKAVVAKRAKEAEAKSLLDGIDAYLLERLGIEMPVATETKKTFFVRFSKLSGNRFDPEFIAYQAKIASDKYPTVQLKQLLKTTPQYGANESGIERIDKSQPRYIRITDIDEFGRLDESALGKTAATIEERYILHNNDLLFARSGNTVGKCYLHKSDSIDYECFFAGYMIRFIVNETQALPDFIFYWAQTKFYKDWVNAIRRAAGQPNINAEEYKSLLIPLPPLEIQEGIAAHIQSIRERAKELEREAQAEVECAKAEAEQIILGEVSADA
jgi:restriction endonuclease S subunit